MEWCYEQAARRLNAKNPMPAYFGASQFEAWAKSAKELGAVHARGDVFVRDHEHGGLVTGPALPGGIFPSVEGNTWAKTDYAHRREGYALEKRRSSAAPLLICHDIATHSGSVAVASALQLEQFAQRTGDPRRAPQCNA